MWVQTRIDADVRDEAEDRDPDRLVNLTYCRAVRVRGVRAAEQEVSSGAEPVDDTSNSGDGSSTASLPLETEPGEPTNRRWEVVAALALERAAPGMRTTEILAAVATEDEARRLFRAVRSALLDGRAGIDLTEGGTVTESRIVARPRTSARAAARRTNH